MDPVVKQLMTYDLAGLGTYILVIHVYKAYAVTNFYNLLSFKPVLRKAK